MKAELLTLLILVSGLPPIRADVVAQWPFNSVPPDGEPTTGTNVPSTGIGTAWVIGGVTATFSTGGTNDPASGTDDSGWQTTSYPPQFGGNKTAGVQFNVNTVGYSNIVVRWDQRVTSTASKYYRMQNSIDGGTFVDYQTPIVMQAAPATASYYEAKTNSLAATFGVNNNQNFAFRILSEFESTAINSGAVGYVTVSNSTYNPGANVRFDYVTVLGTLIPGGNTAPTITGIGNQTIRVTQSTGALSFTVLDAEDPAASLTLNAVSSAPNVVPVGNVVFGGGGASRTVNVTAGTQSGVASVTVWVIDTGGKSNSTSFTVTVLPANTAPIISGIAATNTPMYAATPPIGFTVGDAETPAANLTLSGSSANTALVPNSSIAFGGGGSNRTVTITPTAGQSGVAPITITVSDGTNSASSMFALMVPPSAGVVFYEPFVYADGSLLTNSGFLWQNRSGTLGACQVTNGQLQVSSTISEDVVGKLIGAPYNRSNGTALYASFKVKFLTVPNSTPDYFAHFGTGSGIRARVYGFIPVGASFGTLRLAIGNATNSAEIPVDLTTNTTYALVTRYNIDNASSTLWLNPTAESDPGVTAADVTSAVNISDFGFREATGLDSVLLVDDLKVGLSFGAVTGTNPVVGSPIPLGWQRIGNNIALSWTNSAFALQAAGVASGPFTNVPLVVSPYTNVLTGGARFFRLRAN